MSKSLQVTGAITEITEAKDVGKTKPYMKRQFVLADPDAKEEWPNFFVFEIGGTNIDKIDGHAIGDTVTVSFNLKCRGAWNDKWFANVEAWRIESVSKAVSGSAPNSDSGSNGMPNDMDADIPF